MAERIPGCTRIRRSAGADTGSEPAGKQLRIAGMAILTISGAPSSRVEDVAHESAQLLDFDLVTESRLSQWMTEEFGETPVPDRGWRPAAVSILARMALEHHLVICVPGAESLFPLSRFTLRAQVLAPDAHRIGNVMLDQRLERPEAKA